MELVGKKIMISTVKSNFFDVFGAINTFSYNDFAWNTYLSYAISRITNAMYIIQNAEKQRKNFSIEELQEELDFVGDYLLQLTKIEKMPKSAHNIEFKTIVLNFIEAVKNYQLALEDELENKVAFYNSQLHQARLISKYLD